MSRAVKKVLGWEDVRDLHGLLLVLSQNNRYRGLFWFSVHLVLEELAPFVKDEHLMLATWVSDVTRRRACNRVPRDEFQAVRYAVYEGVVLPDREYFDTPFGERPRRPISWAMNCFEYAVSSGIPPLGSLTYLAACIASGHEEDAYSFGTQIDPQVLIEPDRKMVEEIHLFIPKHPSKTQYVFFEGRPVCPETLYTLPPDMLTRWDAACERGEVHF